MRNFIQKYRGGIAFAALMWALCAAVYTLAGWWLLGAVVLLFLGFDFITEGWRIELRAAGVSRTFANLFD